MIWHFTFSVAPQLTIILGQITAVKIFISSVTFLFKRFLTDERVLKKMVKLRQFVGGKNGCRTVAMCSRVYRDFQQVNACTATPKRVSRS